jgi:hypothetical protein
MVKSVKADTDIKHLFLQFKHLHQLFNIISPGDVSIYDAMSLLVPITIMGLLNLTSFVSRLEAEETETIFFLTGQFVK